MLVYSGGSLRRASDGCAGCVTRVLGTSSCGAQPIHNINLIIRCSTITMHASGDSKLPITSLACSRFIVTLLYFISFALS